MEILETNKTPEKSFSQSLVTLENRNTLNITGVEKVYETTPKQIQLKVMGSNVCIGGDGLNIAKLDVTAGTIQIEGLICEIKYQQGQNKENILKKLFK